MLSSPDFKRLSPTLRIAALVGAVLIFTAQLSPAGDSPLTLRLIEPGEKLESMVLEDRQGSSHDISRPMDGVEGSGPVAIYFWSVFCPNCKEVMPDLVNFYNKWRPYGLTLWAVNVDGARFSNAVDAYLEDSGLPLPVVMDRLDGELLIAADPLGVSKTPTLYLADAEGVVVLLQEIKIETAAADRAMAEMTGK